MACWPNLRLGQWLGPRLQTTYPYLGVGRGKIQPYGWCGRALAKLSYTSYGLKSEQRLQEVHSHHRSRRNTLSLLGWCVWVAGAGELSTEPPLTPGPLGWEAIGD